MKLMSQSLVQKVHETKSFTDIDVLDVSYSWWCKPISIRKHGYNYFAYIQLNGHFVVARADDEGNVITKTVRTGPSTDEHNTPSILVRETDIVVTYNGHNMPDTFRDILDLNLNTTHSRLSIMGSPGGYSYSQLIEASGKIFCFCRSGDSTEWSVVWSEDGGVTWGTRQTLIIKDQAVGNKLYLSSILLPDKRTIAIGGFNHILSGIGNKLFMFEVDSLTGDITEDGSYVTNLYSGFMVLQAASFAAIKLCTTDSNWFRFLDIAQDSVNYYFAVAETTSTNYHLGDYKILTYNKSTKAISEQTLIAHGKDGYSTYWGGVYFSQTDDSYHDGIIYLSREENEVFYVERWGKVGGDYVRIESIDSLATGTTTGQDGVGLYRPQPPLNRINGGANVIYQSGNYFEGYTSWDNVVKLRQ